MTFVVSTVMEIVNLLRHTSEPVQAEADQWMPFRYSQYFLQEA